MHGRFALFIALFLTMVVLACLGTQSPAWAQSTPAETIPPDATPMYLPMIALAQPTPTSTIPPRVYTSVPVAGGSIGGPAQNSPDVNLALRSYAPTTAYLGLVNYGGDTDVDAPQVAQMFNPARLPAFPGAQQVYDWNWGCNPPTGCRGNPITWPYNVTMIDLATNLGEPLAIPSRNPQIYSGGYKAMVLYAEARRITLTYTREDTAAAGYLIHLEELAVAPELLALYQQLDAGGRRRLPALRNGEVLGTADRASLKIAIRDTGMFMDPRACKDWWNNYMGACTVQLRRPLIP